MITDTLLLFTIKYIDRLENSETSSDERELLGYELSHTFPDSSADNQNPTLELALQRYIELSAEDLQKIPLHVHLWFVEYARNPRELLNDLYGKIDIPLVRYAIVEAVINRRGDADQLYSFSAPEDVQEYAEILLDLRQYNVLRQLILKLLSEQTDTNSLISFILERRAYITGTDGDELNRFLDDRKPNQ